MQRLTFDEIVAMKGNGSSMRQVLKCLIDKGAEVYLMHESGDVVVDRLFLIKYEELKIPLRAYKLNFYSTFNSFLAGKVTSSKERSHAVLMEWDIPTPETFICNEALDQGALFRNQTSYVVKPVMGAHGDGISLGIKNEEELAAAVAIARQQDNNVLIQRQVDGEDHRLLFMNYEFVAAVRRTPATIKGDGKHSVREIIEASNQAVSELWQQIRNGASEAQEVRGTTSKIPLDEVANARGSDFLNFVPAQDEMVQVLDKANVSLGGQTYDVTDEVNQHLTQKISQLLRAIDLPFCGVDVLSTDIATDPNDGKSFVIELNAAPGLRLHEMPYEGQPRPVCEMMADSLINHYRSTH